jgi:hypothetical protein
MKSTFLLKKKHFRRKGNFDLAVEYFSFYMRGNNFIIFKYYSKSTTIYTVTGLKSVHGGIQCYACEYDGKNR